MDSEDSDQTGRMPRLICLRWAHCHFAGFVMLRLTFKLAHLCQIDSSSLATLMSIINFKVNLVYYFFDRHSCNLDPDQMPWCAVSDMGLLCLTRSFSWDAMY